MAEAAGRVCSVDGCAHPHRARGLCSTHYNQTRPNRHPKMLVACAWCGAAREKDVGRHRRYGRLFCSMACRSRYDLANQSGGYSAATRAKIAAWAQSEVGRAARSRSARWTPRRRAESRLLRAAAGVKGWGVWSSGPCAHCGEMYVRHSSTTPTPWCSKQCRNAARSRRHAAGKGAYGRLEIFKRDGWRCHLCGKLTDRTKRHPHPKAPTIDHLIPRADGGEDTLENVRTAHSLCNSRRRQFGTVQLLLFGEVA